MVRRRMRRQMRMRMMMRRQTAGQSAQAGATAGTAADGAVMRGYGGGGEVSVDAVRIGHRQEGVLDGRKEDCLNVCKHYHIGIDIIGVGFISKNINRSSNRR